MKYYIFFFSFLFCGFLGPSFAQNIIGPGDSDSTKNMHMAHGNKLHIISINVLGNKKTKTYIILRELHFKVGDSITTSDLNKNLIQAKQQVYNTRLFTDVQVTPEFISAFEIKINVIVKEKWYLYPTPQFQLVDRNFNEWIKTYNASLGRVIYGAKFAHYNLSGRRDQLRIYLLSGYARNISLSYLAPASNMSLTEGFGVSAGYTQNREISYRTSYLNKLLQYKNDSSFARKAFNSSVTYYVRKGLFKSHFYRFGFSHIAVTDSVLSPGFNPSYFNTNRSSISYPDVLYGFQYSNTDNNNYPLKGKVSALTFFKRGTGITGGINMFSIDASMNKYSSYSNNWYSSIEIGYKIKLPFTQAYINQGALGYQGFYLRGLEYYVVDGVAAMLARSTLKKKIIAFKIPMPFHLKALPTIPITLFAKTFVDVGYSYNKKDLDTRLNNRLLYTGGFGIDLLTFYDINLKFEYSFNQLGENGLFLHAKGGF
ncbi:MAG: POTRA domain-containing protein [Ferruginibacter sp.]